MAYSQEEKLGEYKDKTHLLFWEVRPNMDDIDEFVVNISYSVLSPEPERIQIVRIDNVNKSLHIDELWKKVSQSNL